MKVGMLLLHSTLRVLIPYTKQLYFHMVFLLEWSHKSLHQEILQLANKKSWPALMFVLVEQLLKSCCLGSTLLQLGRKMTSLLLKSLPKNWYYTVRPVILLIVCIWKNGQVYKCRPRLMQRYYFIGPYKRVKRFNVSCVLIMWACRC
jgi:hypothetical protein